MKARLGSFATTTQRNAAMAAAYLGAGLTLSEVGVRFGLTKQQVHRILRTLPGVALRPRGRTKTSGLSRYLGGAR